MKDLTGDIGEQDTQAQQVKFCPTKHLALDKLEPIDMAFDPTIRTNRQLYLIKRLKRMNLR